MRIFPSLYRPQSNVGGENLFKSSHKNIHEKALTNEERDKKFIGISVKPLNKDENHALRGSNLNVWLRSKLILI